MITFTGEQVDPMGGTPSLYSVGVGLGRMPRFAGQARSWYPVLAHVLVVARLLPPELAIHGLLHDAPEAVVADVPSPLKTRQASELEECILGRIYHALRLMTPTASERAQIKHADLAALGAEAHVLEHPAAEQIMAFRDVDRSALLHTTAELSSCRDYLEPGKAAAVFLRAMSAARVAHRKAA